MTEPANWPLITSPSSDPRSERRREDLRFVTGAGNYLDDKASAGALHGHVLRSPYSHALILSIDVSEASSMPGVRAVLTHPDLIAAGVGNIPCFYRVDTVGEMVIPPYPALAHDRVLYVGEPVAFVVADTFAQARDASEAIAVDYEGLPSITDTAAATDEGAAQVWPQAPGNRSFRFEKGDGTAVADRLARSAHVVECRFVNNRVAAAALEPRIAIGQWDGARYRLEISGATVHGIRRELAEGVFGVALEDMVVSTPDVGGGFGMKNVTYAEYVLVLAAARLTGSAVRWVAERTEDFTAGVHGRDSIWTASLGIDENGRFTALNVENIANQGAYLASHGPVVATTAPASAMGGLYDIPAVSYRSCGLFTNTSPVDAYRGAGKPEANYLIERLIDMAAHKTGLDAAEMRRRNLIALFPHRTAMGSMIDGGDFLGNFEIALSAADHDGFAARKERSASRGLLRGIGMGCFLETARGAPAELAILSVEPDGSVELAIGTQSNGQGHETSFARVAAGLLEIDADRFRFVQGDTGRIASGGGHGGARSLHMGGQAIVLAARDLIANAREAAAGLMQEAPDALTYAAGAFHVDAGGGAIPRSIGLRQIALSMAAAGSRLQGRGDNVCMDVTFPNGAHVAEVEIDPDTGEVSLQRYTAIDDYGNLVNPLLVEGQIHGGLAQGIGQALMEEIRYEAGSGQILTASFMDYAVPRAADLPDLDVAFREIPTSANELGAKGSGQAGCIGAPQTIMNAVLDALRPLGVTDLDMPATPQRIWHAIEAAKPAGRQG